MLDETVGHVQREALVPVQLGLEPAEEGGDGRGVAGRQVGLELRKLRRVLLQGAGGAARRRLGGEDREGQAEQEERDDRRGPARHRAASTTCSTWLIPGFSTRCTIPLGHAIST